MASGQVFYYFKKIFFLGGGGVIKFGMFTYVAHFDPKGEIYIKVAYYSFIRVQEVYAISMQI